MVPAPTPARSATSGTAVPWKPRSTNSSSAACRIASRLSAPRSVVGAGRRAAEGSRERARGDTQNEYSFRHQNASLISRVPVIPPWIRGVGVAPKLPEPELVFREQLDPVHPLGALPGVELRRVHAARPAVIGRQRPAVDGVGEQDVGLERLLER